MDNLVEYVGFVLFLLGGILLIGVFSEYILPKLEETFWDIWGAHTEHNQLRCYQCEQLIEGNDDCYVCIKCGEGYNLPLKINKGKGE